MARMTGNVKLSIDHLRDELDRLRDVVWALTEYEARRCLVCWQNTRDDEEPHEPDCAWLAEDQRRKANQ